MGDYGSFAVPLPIGVAECRAQMRGTDPGPGDRRGPGPSIGANDATAYCAAAYGLASLRA